MSENKINTKKISTFGFFSFCIVLVYSIANSEQMYYQMGYASIVYVIIAGLIFFIPYSFAVTEIGSAYSDKKGGIYSWLSEIIGEKYALVTTLIWFSTKLLSGLALSAICITFSTLFFGKDISETWRIFGLSNQMTTTLIGSIWVIFWIYITTRGIKTVELLSKISMGLFFYGNLFIILVSFLVFAKNGFHFAQPIDLHSIGAFFTSPNPQYHSIFSVLGFLVFAIMSLGGMESAVGLIDQVENPHKTVPKAIFLTVIIMLVLTIVVIIGNGMVINWHDVYNNGNINLYNFSVYMTLKYSYSLGTLIGLTPVHAIVFSKWYLIVNSWIGALAFLQLPLGFYYPIKQLIEGLPEGMLPKKFTKINKHGFPANALWAEGIFMIIFAFAVVLIFRNNANQIYNYTMFMVTISSVIPWGFITFAYIKFKLNDNIPKQYEFFNKKIGVGLNILSLCAIIFSIVFSIIQPWTQPGGAEQGILMIFGPILFGLLGFLIAYRYQKAKNRNSI
ncbi:amino acid permease [uncultured Clostridium sp.]|uniref:amino acid permease n=1 Tax=uncultured Clostridium sp. TaxID=59620 RepID=UPI00261B8B65|nr:amino acid permease [uncultured Clostridium sp.]